ncbi:MAG TPA: succinylglutamate desuccinylase/aspartoacylase family protein [bacterium]|nr:succinylglutamate desuccinylase/aspartoacylase family protein [bacterium]
MRVASASDIRPGTRGFFQIPVCTMSSGILMHQTFHVIRGAREGPTLGLISNSRGIGHLSIEQVRAVLAAVDPAELSGTVIACPVANPAAFEHRRLTTPVDELNMNRLFPGTSAERLGGRYAGGLTELMAHHVTRHVIEPADIVIDLHLLSDRLGLETIDLPTQAGEGARARIRQLASLFGTTLHEWEVEEGSAAVYAIARGKLGFGVEIGGGAFGPGPAAKWVAQVVAGVHGVMQAVGMLAGDPGWPAAVTMVTTRVGVRPRNGGYHVPEVGVEHLGATVETGRLLGRVYDVQTFELVEELRSPCDGLLYVIRALGPTEPGDWGYVIGERQGLWTYTP